MPKYGTVYGMQKTTIYLPRELKRDLEEAAAASGRSEADVVRDALARLTARTRWPRPRMPLFHSGRRTLAERVDQALKGFGER